jgi:formate hydrogenlyase subunit 3/multisubunit Na+/H+ antiporter MnhD subunit
LILNRIFLSAVTFLFFTTLTILNYILDYYQDIILLSDFNTSSDINMVNIFLFDKIFSIQSINLNLCQVYYYPFIYVFLLITVLSIIFCLSYNSDELVSFMFYCQVILIAGYVLFFTDSLILFFLSYEMLLIPSFFILYKFAKTRRCVEAAYLMFF